MVYTLSTENRPGDAVADFDALLDGSGERFTPQGQAAHDRSIYGPPPAASDQHREARRAIAFTDMNAEVIEVTETGS